jgi:hypothetical protein
MKNLFLALLLLVPGLTIVAQEEEGEVIVISELSRPEVREFIEEAEDQFYEIFNANIDDEDYKITCSRQTPTGTNIPIRVCEPQFMLRARADNQSTFQFNRGAELTNEALRASLQPEFDRLQAKMEEMTQEIPEFAQIASILSQLRARLAELTN